LISDTHMPERLAALPPAAFTALRGVDLLLHAGDVGELWVLDQLSTIAPVIAVHGNDDTPDARRELPYQQVIAVAGTRIFLTHGHFEDQRIEQEVRRREHWEPLFAINTNRAARAGAHAFVSGHTHIPLVVHHAGVLLINPGAVASANERLRQTLRSVAILDVLDDGALRVSHIDLDSGQPFQPDVDVAAPFAEASARVCRSILTPDLEGLLSELRPLRAQAPVAFRAAAVRAAHRCWSGELELIGPQELLAELRNEPLLPEGVVAQCATLLERR
jgi:putative phosphoesterase